MKEQYEEIQEMMKEVNIQSRFNKAILIITEFLVREKGQVKFLIVENATNNYREFLKIGQPFQISLEGCDNTIYGNQYINMLSRVWHDEVHLNNKYNFTYYSETEVCRKQTIEIAKWLSNKDEYLEYLLDIVDILEIEIIEQYKHYITTGMYVENQYEFTFNKYKERTMK